MDLPRPGRHTEELKTCRYKLLLILIGRAARPAFCTPAFCSTRLTLGGGRDRRSSILKESVETSSSQKQVRGRQDSGA